MALHCEVCRFINHNKDLQFNKRTHICMLCERIFIKGGATYDKSTVAAIVEHDVYGKTDSIPLVRKPSLVYKKKKRAAKKTTVPIQPLPISINNYYIATAGTFEEIPEIPKGFKLITKTDRSTYYTNEGKDIIIRDSDHWGYAIGYCNWFLYGYNEVVCWKWSKYYGRRIGQINIKDLSVSSYCTPIAEQKTPSNNDGVAHK